MFSRPWVSTEPGRARPTRPHLAASVPALTRDSRTCASRTRAPAPRAISHHIAPPTAAKAPSGRARHVWLLRRVLTVAELLLVLRQLPFQLVYAFVHARVRVFRALLGMSDECISVLGMDDHFHAGGVLRRI